MKNIIFCVFLALALTNSIEGASTSKKGYIKDIERAPSMPIESHYSLGLESLDRCDYEEAIRQFAVVISNFTGFSHLAESHYFLGIAYFRVEEYDFANDSFTNYLKCTNQPKYFEETLGYKYTIAEKFRLGAKRHFFGTKQMPKWGSGHALALQIYDEVIYSLPCHEYAALSLFAKASMLWSNYEWREAVDCYQTLIRRFPKHELAPQAYLCINRVYLEQSAREFQNPDLIVLAQINLRKFAKDFPKDERLANAEADVQCIKEVYAGGLYGTARYYERTGKIGASIIYYQSAIKQFPDTKIAERCQNRLIELNAVPEGLASNS